MLSPNAHSFLLERKRHTTPPPSSVATAQSVAHAVFDESTTGIPVKSLTQTTEHQELFFPSTDSFILVKQSRTGRPAFSLLLSHEHSFHLVSPRAPMAGHSPEGAPEKEGAPQGEGEPDPEQINVDDQKKRTFLKAAGVAGAGLVASQLFPKEASALIMGSSPTTGVVGMKNASNARINPATEETVDQILKTSDLTFDAGALQVKVTSVSGDGSSSFSDSGDVARSALVDAQRHVQVDVLSSALPSAASTETTLQTISFGGFKFTLRMETVGSIDYVGEASIGTATSAASWRIKKVDNSSGIVLQWAGSGVFDQVWDNRASLSYS